MLSFDYDPTTSAEKPSYGVPKIALVAWTPDATNMAPVLKISAGVGTYAISILDDNGVPRCPR